MRLHNCGKQGMRAIGFSFVVVAKVECCTPPPYAELAQI
jgi:hypothetical protein